MLTAALALPALALGACRDVALPAHGSARLDALFTVGHPSAASASDLHVLAGELVTATGAGLASATRVSVGSLVATPRSIADVAVVFEVPELGAPGAYPVAISTNKLGTTNSVTLQYDGPGAPGGARSTDIDTRTPLFQLSPLRASAAVHADVDGNAALGALVMAAGVSDSATVLMGGLNAGYRAIPTGVLPATIAARLLEPQAGVFEGEVIAVDRRGKVGRGVITQSRDLSQPPQLDMDVPVAVPALATGAIGCSVDSQLAFTSGGARLAVSYSLARSDEWYAPAKRHIGYVDLSAKDVPFPVRVDAPVWTMLALPDDASFALTKAPGLCFVDADCAPKATGACVGADATNKKPGVCATPSVGLLTTGATTWRALDAPPAGTTTVDSLVASAICNALPDLQTFPYALAVSPDGKRLAVSILRSSLPNELVEIDLAQGAVVGHMVTGVPVTALAYVNVGGVSTLVAAAQSTLWRLTTEVGVPSKGLGGDPACAGSPNTLAVDAAYVVSADAQAQIYPPMLTAVTDAGGAGRLLVIDPASGDVHTVLADSMTALAPLERPAGYASIALSPSFGTDGTVLAVAAHTWTQSALDTAGMSFVVPLDGSSSGIAIGAPGYGHGGFFWTEAGTSGFFFGSAGEPLSPVTSLNGAVADAAAVFDLSCSGEFYAGLFSPQMPAIIAASGGAAFGPSGGVNAGAEGPFHYFFFDAPTGGGAGNIYAVPDSSPCISKASTCVNASGVSKIPVAVANHAVLDVVPSASDATVALRTLDLASPITWPSACGACQTSGPAAQPAYCTRVCNDLSADVVLFDRAGGALKATTTLAAPPVSLVADRAGGFLASIYCPDSNGWCLDACKGRFYPGKDVGALVFVPEDGGSPRCLVAGPGLAGVVAITPNGNEAWVSGPPSTNTGSNGLELARVAIPRAVDGSIDFSDAAIPGSPSRDWLGDTSDFPPGLPASGIAFTSDGSLGLVTVPAQSRIATFQ